MRRARVIATIIVLLGALAFAWRDGTPGVAAAPLIAFYAWLGWPLGAMALLLIHALTGGAWGEALAASLFSGVRSMALAPLFFAPTALLAPRLYSWLRPDLAPPPNAFWLNGAGASLRVAIDLGAWLVLAFLIARRRGDPAAIASIAPAGLIVLALTASFASIDAVMSLDPHFVSSVFPMMELSEMLLFAMAIALALTIRRGIRPELLAMLSKLLLALVILWAYLDFMQLLIAWQSDLPSDADWYRPRLGGGWGAVAAIIALTHFLLPFALLLSRAARRSRSVIGSIAALLAFTHVLRVVWLVAPTTQSGMATALLAAVTLAAFAFLSMRFERTAERETAT